MPKKEKQQVAHPDIADAIRDLPPLLRVSEAADVLRVSTRTIHEWIASGRIRSVRVVPGAGTSRRLIPRSSVVELLMRSIVDG